MNILYGEPATGKTITLLKMSADQQIPIVVVDSYYCEHLKIRAKKLGLEIPEPVTWNDIRLGLVKLRHITHCLIDETEYFLSTVLGGHVTVEALTMLKPNTEVLVSDGKFDWNTLQDLQKENEELKKELAELKAYKSWKESPEDMGR